MTNNDLVEGLSHLLANTYVLYTQTQNFHWNVTGAHFFSLHAAFEEQYKALAEAVDEIAERIRSLDAFAPATLTEFLALASLKESSPREDRAMLKTLLSHHEAICTQLISLIVVAQSVEDEVTADMLIERKAEHDKTAWMLRSMLK